MALQYFKRHSEGAEDYILKAKEKLEKGYKRLVTFETASGGFEWFGEEPGHESLTAYGLMQFHEMNDVLEVDENLLPRV